MTTLEDAWQWYEDVKRTLKRMYRLGARYWNVIPWDQPPWRNDNHFIFLETEDITAPATNALRHLDDLAIVVLFSVFEAIVRGNILEQIGRTDSPRQHPVVRQAIDAAKDRIGEGSFYRVLESYKGIDDPLIEEVNQVRKYRNWVAHGKRAAQPPFVSPDVAHNRLARFLARFFAPVIITEEWIALMREGGD